MCSCRNPKAKDRWWCSSGARCSESNLEFHRHPFENDLEKCHDFVLETGIELSQVHASREEADNETRRVLNVQKKENHLASAMARGGDERRAGAGGAASEVAAASTRTTVASTDVSATAPPEEDGGDAAATAGSLGAGEGEGSAKDSSDDESDGRDKVDTTEPGQDGELGSAASPASSTRNRDERCVCVKGEDLKTSSAIRARQPTAEDGPSQSSGRQVTRHQESHWVGFIVGESTLCTREVHLTSPSARKTVEVKRSHSTVSKPAARQPGQKARPTLSAGRRAKNDVKLGSAATPASRTSDGAKSSARKTVGVKRSHVSKPAASQPGQAAGPAVVAAEPEQEDKVADASPRVGSTTSATKASVAHRTTGAVVAKARSPKSPLPLTKSSSSTRTLGDDIKIPSAMSRSSAKRKGEDLKTSSAIRARQPTAEDGPSQSSGRQVTRHQEPSARKTVGVKRSHSTVSKPAARQPGQKARPPVVAFKSKKVSKLGSAATIGKSVAEDCLSELTVKARKHSLPASASVHRPSGANTAPTKAPARAIRSCPPAKLSPGQWECTAQAPRPILGRSYGSAFVPWRSRAREAELQPQVRR
ncbi:unnamed protein product, partial [Ectocarpus sp. 13 AM-2016]